MPTQQTDTQMLPRWPIRYLYYAIALARCSADTYVWSLVRVALGTRSTLATRRSCLTRIRDRLHFSMRHTGYFYRSWLASQPALDSKKSDATILIRFTKIEQTRAAIKNFLSLVGPTQSIWVLVNDDSLDLSPLLSDENVRILNTAKPLELNQLTQKYLYVTGDDFHTHSDSITRLAACAEQIAADLAYGDEDQLLDGQRCKPLFKPDFDPILLEAHDYIGPNFLARLDLIQRYPGLLINKDILKNHQDITVGHLTFPIVSQITPTSRQLNNGRTKTESNRRFSLIIPTKDQPLLLNRLTKQLLDLGRGSRLQLTVLDNSDRHSETQTLLAELKNRYPHLSVINIDEPFNWSRFNNKAASQSDGDILVFLNDDMTLLDPNLLTRLDTNFDNPQVGIVGALLTFPAGQIQHAGIVLGMGGFADHIYRDCPNNIGDFHPFISPHMRRTVSAVTGAFLAIRRDLFECLGGFNEDLRHSGDVELCVRATKKGYRTVFDPSIRFTHHESQTRGSDNLDGSEKKNLTELVPVNERDIFYNPNLSLRSRYPTLRL